MKTQNRSIPFKGYIGDTIVVVIGVLLALAVSEWAKSIDNKSTTRSYLEAIIHDFEENAVLAETGASVARFQADQGEWLLSVVSGDSTTVDARRLIWAIESTGYRYAEPYLKTAWDDLISSGGLGSIRNPETRRLIGQFYRKQEQRGNWESEWMKYFHDYRESLHSVVDPAIRLEIGKIYDFDVDVSSELNLPDKTVDEIIRDFRSTQSMESQLVDLTMTRTVSTVLYSRESIDIQTILTSLREDLSAL